MMKKTEFISIRVPKELKEQIKADAERERRTLANQVIVLIEKGLAEIREQEAVTHE